MALDHSDAVERIAVLDIAPIATMYAHINKEFATRYFCWFFLIQPAPLLERLIGELLPTPWPARVSEVKSAGYANIKRLPR